MSPTIRSLVELPKTQKLWGGEILVINSREQGYCGKVLVLQAGFEGSLHRHARKHETMLVIAGAVELEHASGELDDLSVLTVERLDEGSSIVLPPGTWHRFRALTPQATIVEFSTPHDDEDVERAEPARKLGEPQPIIDTEVT